MSSSADPSVRPRPCVNAEFTIKTDFFTPCPTRQSRRKKELWSDIWEHESEASIVSRQIAHVANTLEDFETSLGWSPSPPPTNQPTYVNDECFISISETTTTLYRGWGHSQIAGVSYGQGLWHEITRRAMRLIQSIGRSLLPHHNLSSHLNECPLDGDFLKGDREKMLWWLNHWRTVPSLAVIERSVKWIWKSLKCQWVTIASMRLSVVCFYCYPLRPGRQSSVYQHCLHDDGNGGFKHSKNPITLKWR